MGCRVCWFVVMLLTLTVASASAARRPNIVLIVADDMGFSDAGCYGGEIRTPNLDRLAAGGVRFTQFYNNTRCCPTRASLMTGMYPHQVGVGAMNQDLGPPAYRGELSERCVTLAEALRGAGYQTGMVGKWHLSNLTVSPKTPNKALLNFEVAGVISESTKSWPCNRSFDEHFGTIAGVGNFFDPWSLVHNEKPITPPKEFYYTDYINDRACELIDQFTRARGGEDKPFFLYVAHTAPHWPLHAKPADIAKYADAYRDGWDAMRERRHRRLIELEIIDRNVALSPHEKPWADASNKEWEARRMAVYAAQIDCMDQGIGRILDQLDQLKLADDTLVLFLSDNGGCAENVQPNWYDIPSKTRDGRDIRIGNDPSIMPGDDTTFQSYGPSWANLSNTPFRRFKHFIEEGGVATPLIVRWPAHFSNSQQLEHAPGHVIDIVPTCLDAAGIAKPKQLEGTSLLVATRPPVRMFWEHEGARGVRDSDFKLVAARDEPWHLYDLAADRTELNDLAGSRSDKVAQLQKLYDDWARRCGVQPWPVR